MDIRIECESLRIIENTHLVQVIVNGEDYTDGILDLNLERSWNRDIPWTLTLKILATDKKKHMSRIVEEEFQKG